MSVAVKDKRPFSIWFAVAATALVVVKDSYLGTLCDSDYTILSTIGKVLTTYVVSSYLSFTVILLLFVLWLWRKRTTTFALHIYYFLLAAIVAFSWVNMTFEPFMPKRSPFDTFRTAAEGNSNVKMAVRWAKEILQDTNEPSASFSFNPQLQLESRSIEKLKIPKEVSLIGQHLIGDYADPPNVSVYRDPVQTQQFVAINYNVGRASSYGLIVGSTNLFLRPGWVTQYDRRGDGVFIYEQLYNR